MTTVTQGDDVLELTSSPASISSLAGNDSVTTTLTGSAVLTSHQDGGDGDDTLTSSIKAGSQSLSDVVVSGATTIIGGDGVDVIDATTRFDAFAHLGFSGDLELQQVTSTNEITDTGAGGTITAKAEAHASGRIGGSFTASNAVDTSDGDDIINLTSQALHFAGNTVHSNSGADYVRARSTIGSNYVTSDTTGRHEIDAGRDDDEVYSDIFILGSRVSPDLESAATMVLTGGHGADSLRSSTDSNYGAVVTDTRIYGGVGTDQLSAFASSRGGASSHAFLVDGGAGSDRLSVFANASGTDADINVRLEGRGGADNLFADSDLDGSSGLLSSSHVLSGGAGADTLNSSHSLSGYQGESVAVALDGGFGRDKLDASLRIRGEDAASQATLTLDGGGGNDNLQARSQISGGDRSPDATSLPTVTHALNGGNGRDELVSEFQNGGTLGTHDLSGGIGHDRITATAGEFAAISGGRGRDTIYSSAENATIDGGSGSDWIAVAGTGTRTLTLGGGSDVVVVDSYSGAGVTRITDWNPRVDAIAMSYVYRGYSTPAYARFNALVSSYGTVGGDSYLELSTGLRLEFAGFVPAGDLSDIRSFVSAPSQVQSSYFYFGYF